MMPNTGRRDPSLSCVWETARKNLRPFMGLFFCCLSAFCFSLVSLTVRLASRLWEVLQIIWYRAVIQVIVGMGTLGLRSLQARKFPCWSDVFGPRPLRVYVLGRGVFGALANGLQFFVLTQMPIGEASAVFLTSPLFTTVIAWLWLGERWGRLDSLAAVLMLLGTVLLAQPEFIFPPENTIFLRGEGEGEGRETETETEKGTEETASPVVVPRWSAVLFGLLAAFLSGITLNMIRRAKEADPLCFTLSFSISSLVLSSVAMPIFSPLNSESTAVRAAVSSFSSLSKFWNLWGWITLVGLCGFGAHWFQAAGMKFERAGLVAFVRRSDVIWAFIFQAFVLGQPVTLISLLGSLLVVAGVCVIAGDKLMSERRKRREEGERKEDTVVSFSDEKTAARQVLKGVGESAEEEEQAQTHPILKDSRIHCLLAQSQVSLLPAEETKDSHQTPTTLLPRPHHFNLPLPPSLMIEARLRLQQTGFVVLPMGKGVEKDLKRVADLASEIVGVPLPSGDAYGGKGGSSRQTIGDSPFLNVSGALAGTPSFLENRLHTEMAYAASLPRWLAFCLVKQSKSPALTLLGDSASMGRELSASLVEKFLSLGVVYVRQFHDESERGVDAFFFDSWQKAFRAETAEAAVETASKNALVEKGGYVRLRSTLERHRDGRRLTLRTWAPVFHEMEGEGLVWSGAVLNRHGTKFDGHPVFGQVENCERPNHVVWGDGSEMSENELEELRRATERCTRRIELTDGDVMIVDNLRLQHGRSKFEGGQGGRLMGVMILGSVQRNCVLPSDAAV